MVACYGTKLKCDSMTERRQRMWVLKTGKSTTSVSKLCSLPATTEAFVQNMNRCHYQVAQCYGALELEPPPLNPVEFGWEADYVNKDLTLDPDTVLKLI